MQKFAIAIFMLCAASTLQADHGYANFYSHAHGGCVQSEQPCWHPIKNCFAEQQARMEQQETTKRQDESAAKKK